MAGIVVQKDNTRLFVWDLGSAVTKADKMGNITQIGDVGGETEEIDTTAIDSLAREFEAGFTDNGSIEVTQNVTTQEYTAMKSRMDNSDDIAWGISSFNKKGTQVLGLNGQGIVMSVRLTGISVGGLLQVVSSIRVNGPIDSTFVDPIGPQVGTPVSAIAVSGMGGVSTITEAGGTLQCVAAIEPASASNKAVTWSVDDSGTATISSTGLLTAVKDGTATVTATARDGSGVTGTMEVTVSGQ